MSWFHLNDNEVELGALRDRDGFINDADVTVTIKDSAGAEVSGVTFPLTMDYVAASEGVYRAVVDKALAVAEGKSYRAEITVSASGGRDGFWDIDFKARRRNG